MEKNNRGLRKFLSAGLIAVLAVCAAVGGIALVGFNRDKAAPLQILAATEVINGITYEVYNIPDAATLNSSTIRTAMGATPTPRNYFRLTSDINMSGAWTPIPLLAVGNVFDGQGHTINGLTVSVSSDDSDGGLFANLRGTFKNVTFTNVNIAPTGKASARAFGVVSGRITGGTKSTGLNATATIENVRVESGTINGFTSSGAPITTDNTKVFVGGLVGSIQGYGQSDTNRFTVDIKNSYCKVDIIGNDSTGGIVGNIGTAGSADVQNLTVNIDTCFYNGILQGRQVSGGIVGRSMWISQSYMTVNVTNCYTRGSISSTANGKLETGSSDDTDLASRVGGIMGKARPYDSLNRFVYIKNCFVIATLAIGGTGYRGGIVGAMANNGAKTIAFEVENCHYSYSNDGYGFPVADQHIGSGYETTGGSFIENTCQTTTFMRTHAFIQLINKTTSKFRIMETWPHLAFFDDIVILVFDPNGGEFYTTGPLPTNVFLEGGNLNVYLDIGDSPVGNEVPEITRIGYIFEGWNTQADGNGTDYTNINDVTTSLPSQDAYLYAKWTIINFDVTSSNVINMGFFNESTSLTVNSLTIFQEGVYIRTADTGTFVGFQVLKKTEYGNKTASTSWVSLGAGEPYTGPGAVSNEVRLYLYDGTYLINEDFVTNYGHENAGYYEFEFRAVYTTGSVTAVTVEANDRSYGTVKVSGYGGGGSYGIYKDTTSGTITVKATPNDYRTFGSPKFDITAGTGSIDTIDENPDGSWTATASVTSSDFTICVMFASEPYSIKVIAETTGGDAVPSAENPVIDTSVSSVELGDIYENIVIPVTGYRLAGLVGEYKVFNQGTETYDYYLAYNGKIEEEMTPEFFDKYLDSSGMITIVALYVKQYQISINFFKSGIPDDTLDDTVSLVINNRPEPMGQYFDEGVSVTLFIYAPVDMRIDDVTGTGTTLSGNAVSFTLNEDNTINIYYAVMEYYLTLEAQDNHGETLPGVAFTIEGSPISEYTFYETTSFTGITKTVPPGYSFTGWYAVQGSVSNPLSYDPNTKNLTPANLDINTLLGYLDGDCLKIIAVFAEVKTINVTVDGEEGSFSAWLVDSNSASKTPPSGNQIANKETILDTYTNATSLPFIRIQFHPEPFYEVSEDILAYLKDEDDNVDGLRDGDGYVIVSAVDYRPIIISFVPKSYAVETTLHISKKGTIKVDESASIGSPFYIAFTPETGYKVSKWTIKSGDKVLALDDDNIKVSGKSIRIMVSSTWLNANELVASDIINLDITVDTSLDDFVFISIGSVSIIIPVLVVLAFVMARIAKKRKLLYAKYKKQQDINAKNMGYTGQMKNIQDLAKGEGGQ